jgi:hypothetical protein
MNTRARVRYLNVILLLACWSLNQACGLEHIGSLKYINPQRSFSFNTIKYLSPTYSMKDVYSYRLDFSCDNPKFSGLSPELKESFCSPLSNAIPNGMNKLLSGLEMNETQPDLIIWVELKEVKGGRQFWQGDEFNRLIFDLKIIRWGTVIAAHRYSIQFERPSLGLLSSFRTKGESVFEKNIGLVAKDIHQIVFDLDSFYPIYQ